MPKAFLFYAAGRIIRSTTLQTGKDVTPMASMPLIGISGSIETKKNKVFLLQAYFDAISGAGGIPLLLDPHMSSVAIAQCLPALDGILLAGGGDVGPWHFGQEPIPQIGEMTPIRDTFEFALLKEADRLSPMPVFGICRGMQVMNVAAGGTLYQDLATQHPSRTSGLLSHKQERPYEVPTHQVRIEKDSLLYRQIAMESCMVNSMHHQAVDRLGSGYRLTAVSEDGVAEAIEHEAHPFRVAVQWHPERLSDALSHNLFAAFIGSAQAYRREKE